MLTIQSCQYNFFGWSTVSFTYETYHHFVKTIRAKHIEKHAPDDGYIDMDVESLWTYIAKQPTYCLSVHICEWAGEKEFRPQVTWRIPPHEVSKVVELWDKLYAE